MIVKCLNNKECLSGYKFSSCFEQSCDKLFQSPLTLCDPMDYSLPRLLCPWDSPSKNTGVSCHALFQGIFWSKDQTRISCISCTAGGFFTTEPMGKPLSNHIHIYILNMQIFYIYTYTWGFPLCSDSKEIGLQCRRPGFDPWVGKIP